MLAQLLGAPSGLGEVDDDDEDDDDDSEGEGDDDAAADPKALKSKVEIREIEVCWPPSRPDTCHACSCTFARKI